MDDEEIWVVVGTTVEMSVLITEDSKVKDENETLIVEGPTLCDDSISEVLLSSETLDNDRVSEGKLLDSVLDERTAEVEIERSVDILEDMDIEIVDSTEVV